jgi:predicted phage-related endonuclease
MTADLSLRGNRIGGSDVGIILGYSTYGKTPVQVWAEKTGRLPPDTSKSVPQELGDFLEPWLIQKYEQRTGRVVTAVPQLEHPDYPFAIANVDGIVLPKTHGSLADTVLECKSRGWLKQDDQWGEDGTDDVPMDVLLQCLWYLGFKPDFQHAVVSTLFAKTEHRLYNIKRDREIEEMIFRKCSEWHKKYVLGDQMPPPQCEGDVKILYPQATPKTRSVATTNDMENLAALRKAEERVEDAAKELDVAKMRLKAALGNSDELVSESGVKLAKWVNVKGRKSLDIQKLQGKYPEIYNECLRDGTPYRRFTAF